MSDLGGILADALAGLAAAQKVREHSALLTRVLDEAKESSLLALHDSGDLTEETATIVDQCHGDIYSALLAAGMVEHTPKSD